MTIDVYSLAFPLQNLGNAWVNLQALSKRLKPDPLHTCICNPTGLPIKTSPKNSRTAQK